MTKPDRRSEEEASFERILREHKELLRILDRILETGNDRGAGSDSFGVRLNSATIEQHLRRVRAERTRYIATHAADVREVQESAEQTRVNRRGAVD